MKTSSSKSAIEDFIDQIAGDLGLDPHTDASLRQELADHLEEAIEEHQVVGFSEDEAIELAIQTFGSAGRIHRALKRTYLEVYLMTSIGKIIYSKPAVWIGMVLAALVALATLVWGGAGVYELTKLPPSPTAWHDADTDALFLLVFAIPMFVLFVGSIVQWVQTKKLPSKLVIWTAGLTVLLFILADLAVK